MPRINIEDSIWADDRFLRLCIKLGCEFKAVGMITVAFKVAQKYWIPDKKNIPKEAFINSNLMPLIDVFLAKECDDGFYVRGTKANFQWWFDGIEQRKAAGVKRAQKGQRDTSGRWIPLDQISSEIQPSSSSSSSSSSSRKRNKNITIVHDKEIDFDYATGQFNGPKLLELANEWKEIFGNKINLDKEFDKMATWLLSHKNQKKKDYKKFVVNWLNRAYSNNKIYG